MRKRIIVLTALYALAVDSPPPAAAGGGESTARAYRAVNTIRRFRIELSPVVFPVIESSQPTVPSL